VERARNELAEIYEPVPLPMPTADESCDCIRDVYRKCGRSVEETEAAVLAVKSANAEEEYGGPLECSFEEWLQLQVIAEKEYGGGLDCTYKEWREKKADAERVNGGPLRTTYLAWLSERREHQKQVMRQVYDVLFSSVMEKMERDYEGPISVRWTEWFRMTETERIEHVAANIASGYKHYDPQAAQRVRKPAANSWVSYCQALINAKKSPTDAE
jgi:hypothetical protein